MPRLFTLESGREGLPNITLDAHRDGQLSLAAYTHSPSLGGVTSCTSHPLSTAAALALADALLAHLGLSRSTPDNGGAVSKVWSA